MQCRLPICHPLISNVDIVWHVFSILQATETKTQWYNTGSIRQSRLASYRFARGGGTRIYQWEWSFTDVLKVRRNCLTIWSLLQPFLNAFRSRLSRVWYWTSFPRSLDPDRVLDVFRLCLGHLKAIFAFATYLRLAWDVFQLWDSWGLSWGRRRGQVFRLFGNVFKFTLSHLV